VPYSIVTVTWQCADYLSGLVDSMNEKLDEDPELVVVDNGSSDDPGSAAERWRGETRFIAGEGNLGFGRANNLGVREAKHEAVVLLNPDTKLVDASLSALAREAIELQTLVGPRVLNADGSVQPSASASPVGFWPWVSAFVPGGVMPAGMKARTEPWRLDRRTSVTWLTGACIAAPRALLLQLGPFDPRIDLYGEDLDLGLRVSRMGLVSVFDPRVCRVIHYGDVSTIRRFGDRGLGLAAENRRLVLSRTFGRSRERTAWWAERVKLELRVAVKRALGQTTHRDLSALQALRRTGDAHRCSAG
jgi:N-acetylglucosaminyl-diphospho-decaprenol L-rhamnosyltransferase